MQKVMTGCHPSQVLQLQPFEGWSETEAPGPLCSLAAMLKDVHAAWLTSAHSGIAEVTRKFEEVSRAGVQSMEAWLPGAEAPALPSTLPIQAAEHADKLAPALKLPIALESSEGPSAKPAQRTFHITDSDEEEGSGRATAAEASEGKTDEGDDEGKVGADEASKAATGERIKRARTPSTKERQNTPPADPATESEASKQAEQQSSSGNQRPRKHQRAGEEIEEAEQEEEEEGEGIRELEQQFDAVAADKDGSAGGQKEQAGTASQGSVLEQCWELTSDIGGKYHAALKAQDASDVQATFIHSLKNLPTDVLQLRISAAKALASAGRKELPARLLEWKNAVSSAAFQDRYVWHMVRCSSFPASELERSLDDRIKKRAQDENMTACYAEVPRAPTFQDAAIQQQLEDGMKSLLGAIASSAKEQVETYEAMYTAEELASCIKGPLDLSEARVTAAVAAEQKIGLAITQVCAGVEEATLLAAYHPSARDVVEADCQWAWAVLADPNPVRHFLDHRGA